MLKPGQEGILGVNSSQFVVKSADVEQAMAWKNGQFIFTNENIQSILKKLSKWYDIRVSYNRKDKGLTYTGSISKYKNVSEVQVGYTLPKSITEKWHVGRLRVYASADNMLTSTNFYDGYDPRCGTQYQFYHYR